MQDGAVAANGQDDVGALQALFRRQISHPHGGTGFLQSIGHQNVGPVVEQDLRCPLCDAVGQRLAGVWRNVNGHTRSLRICAYLSSVEWLAATTCSATESSSTPGASLFWTNIRYSMLPSGPLTGLKSSPRTTKPLAAA